MKGNGCPTVVLFAFAVLVFSFSGANAQEPATGTDQKVEGYTFVPEKRDFSEDLVPKLRVPEGFRVTVFAHDLENPRIMAAGPNGVIYVTQPNRNRVVALRDRDGDGKVDETRIVVDGIEKVHGIAIHNNKMYLAPPTRVYVADLEPDGSVSKPQLLADGLPDGGQHPNRTLSFGPDGRLYLSVGSSCNACPEPNEEHATILRFDANGARTIYARGLRNTIGFGWHPVTRELWGMDQGSDWRGQDVPPEELNLIVQGRHYGWPWCYGNRQVDRVIAQKPEKTTKKEFCKETEPPALTYQAHSSPMQMVFYTGDHFPAEYRNDAFVTMRGSWNRKPAVGYKVVRIRFDQSGRPEKFEDFLNGFLLDRGEAFLGRPTGLAIMQDGSLLVGDDTNGVIYRVTYGKPR
jgi:glucose/arabinose dehydrogenase